MKNQFSEYYRYSEEEFESIWDNCTFIFDTNILLNLYRFSESTAKEVLENIKALSERVWLPYNAGQEFFKRRLSVIEEQRNSYGKLIESCDKNFNEIIESIKTERHPHLNQTEKIITSIKRLQNKIKNQVESSKTNVIDIENDWILKDITSIFENKVGLPYDTKKIEEIEKEGAKRYKQKIPPGYEDQKKKDINEYGDLIIWNQIIDYAKENNKPILFITDDKKEDWWLKIKQKTISPRPELSKEIKDLAQVNFYMYIFPNFLKYLEKYFKKKFMKNTLEEVENIETYMDYKSYDLLPSTIDNINKNWETALKKFNAINELTRTRDFSKELFTNIGGLSAIDTIVEKIGKASSLADVIFKTYPKYTADSLLNGYKNHEDDVKEE